MGRAWTEHELALSRGLAELVRRERQRRGLSLGQVARESYLSAPTILNVENGRHVPTRTTRAYLLRWLGVTEDAAAELGRQLASGKRAVEA